MNGDVRDAARASRSLITERFREPTAEDLATHQRWLRGVICCYCVLLLVAGVAITNYSSVGLAQLTTNSAHETTTASELASVDTSIKIA